MWPLFKIWIIFIISIFLIFNKHFSTRNVIVTSSMQYSQTGCVWEFVACQIKFQITIFLPYNRKMKMTSSVRSKPNYTLANKFIHTHIHRPNRFTDLLLFFFFFFCVFFPISVSESPGNSSGSSIQNTHAYTQTLKCLRHSIVQRTTTKKSMENNPSPESERYISD